MTNPEIEVKPNESNQGIFIDFVARTAQTQTEDGVLFGSEPLTGTGCMLVAKVEDVGRLIDPNFVDSEFRSLFPVTYTMSVLRVEGTRPEIEVASLTITDGERGYIVVREEGRELVEEDGLPVKVVDDMVGNFMMRNGIFHHIKQL